MAPPPLPESTLIIAPNKVAATKKRKRPAFRPGGKKKPAAKEKQKSSTTSSRATPTLAEEPAAAPKQHHEVPKGVETQKTPDIDGLSQASGAAEDSYSELDKTPAEQDPKTAFKNVGAEVEKKSEPVAEENVESKEKTSLTLKKQDDKDAKATVVKAAAEEASGPSTKSLRQTGTAANNEKVSKAATNATKQSNATKITAPTLRKRGRKTKSTGLVVGASRKQAAASQQSREDDLAQHSSEFSAPAATPTPLTNFPIEPATNAVAAVPLQLPPPREGEVALGQFCSKFKVKPRKRAGKGQGAAAQKKKKEDGEKKKTKSDHGNKQAESETAGPVVQIINGEIVLQESSMVVQKGSQSANADGGDDEEYAVVEEDNEMAIVGASYNSFVNRSTKPQHWSVEETKLFYEALRQVGTDFLLMSEFYPHRTRKQLKRKYQKEYIQNPKLVEMALDPSQRKPLDLSIFQVDKTDIDQVKEQQKKNEAKEQAEKIEEEKNKAKEKEEEATRAELAKSNANQSEEDGMEVVEEDVDEEKQTVESPHHAPIPEPSSQSQANEAVTDEEPLWPIDKSHNTAHDEETVVDEDTMMLEEFHHPDPENFDDIPAHEDDHTGIIEDPTSITEDKTDSTLVVAATRASEAEPPVAAKEPAISLVPTTKKKPTKKPKFRSARPTKKKK